MLVTARYLLTAAKQRQQMLSTERVITDSCLAEKTNVSNSAPELYFKALNAIDIYVHK